MLDFFILCIDEYKILQIFNNRNFPQFLTEKRPKYQPFSPPPSNVHMTFSWIISISDASLRVRKTCMSKKFYDITKSCINKTCMLQT